MGDADPENYQSQPFQLSLMSYQEGDDEPTQSPPPAPSLLINKV